MNQTIVPPDLDDLLAQLKNDIFATLNCIQIGKIESVNLPDQSVEVQIQVKRRIQNDQIVSYPLLVDCPIIVLQGSGAYIDLPIAKDDYCLVLFNDRDIDNWWTTANVKEPKSKRKHSLSDGFALVGINPKSSVLSLDGSVLGIMGSDKKIRISNDIESLMTLMSDLIDAIKEIVTIGSATTQTVNPASQAALETVKTRITTLLEV